MRQSNFVHLLALLYAIARFGQCKDIHEAITLFMHMNELEQAGTMLVLGLLLKQVWEILKDVAGMALGAARWARRQWRHWRRQAARVRRRKEKSPPPADPGSFQTDP